jgi:flagellar hook-associated protein 1 FlgK
MGSLSATMNIAKTALLSTQKAISVTSHNIANAETEGYSRQRVVFSAKNALNFDGLLIGTGVTISQIDRVQDAFKLVQLRDAFSDESMYDTKADNLKQLEALVNDLDGGGLSSKIDTFFNAFHEISNAPSSYAERSVLLSSANILADGFNRMDSDLKADIYRINSQVSTIVEQLNALATQVANYNQQIAETENGASIAGDLRDQRDNVINKIAKIVDIRTLEGAEGQVDIFLGSGEYLVSGINTSQMATNYSDGYPTAFELVLGGSNVNSKITGGVLKGYVDASDQFHDTLEKVNLLSVSIVKEVNTLHLGGYGLDGTTTNNFFNTPNVYTKANTSNTGGTLLTASSVATIGSLTLNDYEVRFSSPTAYSIVNTSTNAVATSGTYTSGAAITFDGLSVTITDSTGAPVAGDIYSISVKTNAAYNMGVSITDTDKIAASSTSDGVPGNNVNALALAALKDTDTISSSTFREYYTSLITDVAIAVNDAVYNADAYELIAEQMLMAKESVTGVSVEEEAINLLRLQRSYEAAARVLRTVDSMFDEILNLR